MLPFFAYIVSYIFDCAGARRWSLLAQWKMRELSELPHFVEHRLNSANEAANLYCSQFPGVYLPDLLPDTRRI